MVTEIAGIDLTPLFDALVILALAFIAYVTKLVKDKTDATHTIAVANQATIQSIDTAQTAQMAVAQPAAAQAASVAIYRSMNDAVKSIETDGMSPEDKASFLAQVAFNEDAGNVRYTIALSHGFLVVENGCVINDSYTGVK